VPRIGRTLAAIGAELAVSRVFRLGHLLHSSPLHVPAQARPEACVGMAWYSSIISFAVV
jgi:hypothetical protein